MSLSLVETQRCRFVSFWLEAGVLLAKDPDISAPTILARYLFVCIIKSTYQIDVPGTKS